MNNENSEKLLNFIELIVFGINVSVELKIFDEDDLLIKVSSVENNAKLSFVNLFPFSINSGFWINPRNSQNFYEILCSMERRVKINQ